MLICAEIEIMLCNLCIKVAVQALRGHNTMRFMYLVAIVTAQGLAVAQEQEGRMLIKRPFPQQGNLFKTW